MPEYLAPGVFVEETSFRAKSIEGVSTTTTGFVGPARSGPTDGVPDIVTTLNEFERVYGDGQPLVFGKSNSELDPPMNNYLWHAVRAFFNEGGKRLYVARVFAPRAGSNGRAGADRPTTEADPKKRVRVEARYPGASSGGRIAFQLRFGQDLRTKTPPKAPTGLTDNDLVWIGKADLVFDAPPPAVGTDPWDDAALTALRTRLGLVAGDVTAPTAVITALRNLAGEGTLAGMTATEKAYGRRIANLAMAAYRSAAEAKEAEWLATKRFAEEHALATARASAVAGALTDLADTASTAAQQVAADTVVAEDVKEEIPAGDAKTEAEKVTVALDALNGAAGPVKTAADAAQAVAGGAVAALTPTGAPATAAELTALEKAVAVARAVAQYLAEPLTALFSPDPALAAVAPGKQTGALYTAVRQADGSYKFTDTAGASQTLAELDTALAGVALVRLVTASVAVPRPGGTTEVFDGLALHPDHKRAGAKDALSARFAAVLSNPSAARDLPIQVVLGSDLTDGPAVAKALFGVDPATTTFDPVKPLVEVTLDLTGGNDGLRPGATEYMDDSGPIDRPKSGLRALEDLDDISIVAAPGSTYGLNSGYGDARTIVNGLIGHAERMRYRIAVLDSANGQTITDVRAFRAQMDSKYAALYYPWVRVLDPITREEINLPPSGFVAGIYARNDIARGVYKAPANEVVTLALGFEQSINKAQQEVLNPEGVNCFRYFEGRGYRLWGARTISSDSEWKYVNLRRYFAYLEHSIDKGTQFAVFEPNGDALWANVRRTIEDFLLNEWQSGALLGDKPEKAYFVRCDRSTMTQNDLDNGRLICLIGVAPLRPAEFVIFRIGQFTADRKS